MNPLEARIQANYEQVQAKVAQSAGRCGRAPDDICTIVVSKMQSVDVIRAAYAVGIRSFGENYPQEAEEKINALRDLEGINWHMIGHMQSRKAGLVAQYFHRIHSMDSLAHAQKLDKALALEQKAMDAFLEMNTGGEESKSGWMIGPEDTWGELLPEIESLLQLKNLKITGLMTMPPLAEQPEASRPFFRKLRRLMDYLNDRIPARPFQELSMGTSADYEVAIEEGSTFIRVGQAVLGPRETI